MVIFHSRTMPLAMIAFGFVNATAGQTASDAILKLREVPNYSWARTTVIPDAPFRMAPVRGQASKDGYAVYHAEVGEKQLHVVSKGDRAVAKIGAEWKTAAKRERDNDKVPVELSELLESQPAAVELNHLIDKIINPRPNADGSWGGVLYAEEAKSMMFRLLRHRAPRPDMKLVGARGSIRIWLQNGLPHRYVLTISGSISLPFGSKELTQTTTVTISEIGSTEVAVPAAAKAILKDAAR